MHRSLVSFLLVWMVSFGALASGEEPASTGAESAPANHLSANLMGLAGFLRVNVGSFGLSYERVLGDRHGVVVGGDFVHVHHDGAHEHSHQWTFGGSVAYRLYLTPPMGPFVGASVGYRRGYGRIGHAGDHHDVQLGNEQLYALAQVGLRYGLPLGFGVLARLGVGYGPYRVWSTGADDAAAQDAVRVARNVLGTQAIALDLEIGVSWSF